MTIHESITSLKFRSNPDFALFAMIQRYTDLVAEMDHLQEAGGDQATASPEYRVAAEEADDLEHRVIATRAETRAGLQAKLSFIRETDYISDEPGLDTGDLRLLVEMILRLDAERVGG